MQPDAIRLSVFVFVFSLMAIWELLHATRRLSRSKSKRWSRNLLVTLISTVLVRLLLPFTAGSASIWAQEANHGLMNISGISNTFLGVVFAVVVMDFCIYCQHVVFHVFSPLWRLHMMHHADQDYDLTTGSRFHPIEIIFSMIVKCAIVVALGGSPVAVLIFEITLSSAAMFNHGNVSIPERLDRILRWIIVTPDMHRVHHSTETNETHSNYGFNLPWWDRLFSTYVKEPEAGHKQMKIGLKHIVDEDQFLPSNMLIMPFKMGGGTYPSACTPARRRVARIGLFVFSISIAYTVIATQFL